MVLPSFSKEFKILVFISLYFSACQPDNEVSFPKDGIYRYLVLDDYDSLYHGSVGYVSKVFIYNMDSLSDSLNYKLTAFAQHYHSSKNISSNNHYRHGYINILSDVQDFEIIPMYYDDVNMVNVEKKIIYKLEIRYDSISQGINTYLYKGGNTDSLLSNKDIRNYSNNTSIYKRLNERWWKDINDLSAEAWNNFEDK